MENLSPNITREEVADTGRKAAEALNSECILDTFEKLNAWSCNREVPPFALLDAALALEHDADWLKYALLVVTQTILRVLEKSASEPTEARLFAGNVEGWLEWLDVHEPTSIAEKWRQTAVTVLFNKNDREGVKEIILSNANREKNKAEHKWEESRQELNETQQELETTRTDLNNARTAQNQAEEQHRRDRKQVAQLTHELETTRTDLNNARTAQSQAEEQHRRDWKQVAQLTHKLETTRTDLNNARTAQNQAEEQHRRDWKQMAQLTHELETTRTDLNNARTAQSQAKEQHRRDRKQVAQRRRVQHGLALFATLFWITAALLGAVRQPWFFQQMLAPIRTELAAQITAGTVQAELSPATQLALASDATDLEELTEIQATVQQTKTELNAVQAELVSTTEGLTATQAELQQTNAELVTAQAELQQTDAELATAQAELQQTDAQLNTVLPALDNTSNTTLTVSTRMYVGPGEEYEERWILPAGEPVLPIGTNISRDWYLLSHRYWISADNIDSKPIPENLPVVTPSRILETAIEGVNLRQGPTTNNEILDIAAAGQAIVLVGWQANSNGQIWYQLDSGLWVFGELVSDVPSDLPEIP